MLQASPDRHVVPPSVLFSEPQGRGVCRGVRRPQREAVHSCRHQQLCLCPLGSTLNYRDRGSACVLRNGVQLASAVHSVTPLARARSICNIKGAFHRNATCRTSCPPSPLLHSARNENAAPRNGRFWPPRVLVHISVKYCIGRGAQGACADCFRVSELPYSYNSPNTLTPIG